MFGQRYPDGRVRARWDAVQSSRAASDERRKRAQVLEQMTPDRALPVELEMTQPAGDVDERRSLAMNRVRQPDAVTGLKKPDLLCGRRAIAGGSAGDHDSSIKWSAPPDATPVTNHSGGGTRRPTRQAGTSGTEEMPLLGPGSARLERAHPVWPGIELGRLPLCQLSYSRPRFGNANRTTAGPATPFNEVYQALCADPAGPVQAALTGAGPLSRIGHRWLVRRTDGPTG
jgi:hypothetical protein